MQNAQIAPGVYSVGVIDWDVRNFHGQTYTTQRGTSYNAYLIIDEKITLVDTVYGPFAPELIRNIRAVVPPEKIDYVVANHVETDHSGAMPALMKLCPRAKVFGTARCKEGLALNYHENWDFQIVKTGDTLDLGRKTLKFIEAPMIHWPDSMFTYCPEEALLMPNDAFGQHYAVSERFDDETDSCALSEEAAKYYANILWPLGQVIERKIAEIRKMNIPLKIIAPSHGVIWRKEPMRIVEKYERWARNETAPRVVVVYETMWHSTEKMARAIADAVAQAGVRVKVYDLAVSDRTEVVASMLEAAGFIFGSSTHDNGMLPTMAAFLEFLKGLKPKNRIAAAFGSYGWAGGAIKEIEGRMEDSGITRALDSLGVQYVPGPAELQRCAEFGAAFAAAVKAGKNGAR